MDRENSPRAGLRPPAILTWRFWASVGSDFRSLRTLRTGSALLPGRRITGSRTRRAWTDVYATPGRLPRIGSRSINPGGRKPWLRNLNGSARTWEFPPDLDSKQNSIFAVYDPAILRAASGSEKRKTIGTLVVNLPSVYRWGHVDRAPRRQAARRWLRKSADVRSLLRRLSP